MLSLSSGGFRGAIYLILTRLHVVFSLRSRTLDQDLISEHGRSHLIEYWQAAKIQTNILQIHIITIWITISWARLSTWIRCKTDLKIVTNASNYYGASNVSYLKVSVHNKSIVHVLQAQNDLRGIEPDLLLREHAVLREVIVQVSSVHQVEDKTQFLRGLEGISHTHYKWAALL